MGAKKECIAICEKQGNKRKTSGQKCVLKKRKSPLLPSNAKETPGLGVIISGLTVMFFCWWSLPMLMGTAA